MMMDLQLPDSLLTDHHLHAEKDGYEYKGEGGVNHYILVKW